MDQGECPRLGPGSGGKSRRGRHKEGRSVFEPHRGVSVTYMGGVEANQEELGPH